MIAHIFVSSEPFVIILGLRAIGRSAPAVRHRRQGHDSGKDSGAGAAPNRASAARRVLWPSAGMAPPAAETVGFEMGYSLKQSRPTPAQSPPRTSTQATMGDEPPTPGQVKVARQLLGWSQADVAGHVGLSKWTIGSFELDKPKVAASRLRRLGAALESAGVTFVEETRAGPGQTRNTGASGCKATKPPLSAPSNSRVPGNTEPSESLFVSLVLKAIRLNRLRVSKSGRTYCVS